jgi:hypothetical protein
VDNSNNVQDAWNSIIQAFEGHDAKGANISKARQNLRKAHWTENKENWSIDDYCSAIWKANTELDRYNANIDPKSQVNMFLQGIKADARVNPQLLAVKAIIVSNDEINGDLFRAINSFKDTMRQVTGMSTGRFG